ncbi:hypothetical protein GQ457_08G002800 [Hibiscus cannabinus]
MRRVIFRWIYVLELNKVRGSTSAIAVIGTTTTPWCIKKKIVTSDLSDMSRLLLAKKLAESHILPHWDDERRAQIHTGVPVSVYDCDTNDEYAMDFKRWKNGAYVFIKKWIPNFVKRRDLKLGDEIGIYWDIHNSRFNFSVLTELRWSNFYFQFFLYENLLVRIGKQVTLFNF